MTQGEMVGWYHQLSGHEFEQTRGSSEGQAGCVAKSRTDHNSNCSVSFL